MASLTLKSNNSLITMNIKVEYITCLSGSSYILYLIKNFKKSLNV